ncbi:type VI secretion system baseplate subunit TssG [Cocleimonas sp. KMM 6892]|uniref:type VI secretion system baseplate subunit TssG n=1 Tax=unclassified Cocleimonas TaxID=2639732 RepID=UPI002DB8E0CD|nr:MULTISPECIES: type VI secretion system baseplate subunit TssG [unclassified Cocleimonas]MEB8434457.1 type VI secretion system baseplate subunit TssG [Cocleimonas sp. KMM 6892]MEC4717350.1 type VI secretion system baseplate subunit TssG [Cocleimonas sp. KMM 6895]MEC4746729.1 type VI secretion system baseplate subunit TssG [Cocleimonas sp. KMM 6896]
MTKITNVIQEIKDNPHEFGFYEALRLIECYYKDRSRLGETLKSADDMIRLGQTPTAAFAPSTLSSATTEKDDLLHLNVFFFGLFGPNGALPLHLTEYANERVRTARDESFIHFLDMFHHRLLCLFYRAWANKEPTVHFDRPKQDKFHNYTGSLLGIGTSGVQDRDQMPDSSKMHYAGHMSSQTHHAEGLSSVLQAFFKVPVRIKEYIGEWLEIPEQSRCYLGMSLDGGKLGEDAVLGDKSWQRQYKFRVLIGPMELDEYEGLLPGKDKIKQVSAILKNYVGMEMIWDVNLILKKEAIPKTELGSFGQLGWSTWLHNSPMQKDADDFLTV